MRTTGESSLNGSANNVYNVANFFSEQRQQGREIGSIAAIWPRWITFAVPQRDNCQKIIPIELHIRSRTIDGIRHDFCAVFDFSGISKDLYDGTERSFADKANLSMDGGSESQSEQLVLVSIFEQIEDGEHWRESRVPSIVRLARLDSCRHWVAESLDSSGSFRKSFGNIAERESEIAMIGGRLLPVSLVDGNCINKVIEGAPKIVDDIPDHQRPSLQGRFNADMGNQAVSGRIGVYLSRDQVGAAILPSPNFIFDGLSMFVGTS
jgi:hypothetical protein